MGDGSNQHRRGGEQKEGGRLTAPGCENRPESAAQPEEPHRRPRQIQGVDGGGRRMEGHLANLTRARSDRQPVLLTHRHREQRVFQSFDPNAIHSDDQLAGSQIGVLGRGTRGNRTHTNTLLDPGGREIKEIERPDGSNQRRSRHHHGDHKDEQQEETAGEHPLSIEGVGSRTSTRGQRSEIRCLRSEAGV